MLELAPLETRTALELWRKTMSQVPNPFNAYREPIGYESATDSITVPQFFNSVYAWMASGLALTAVVAWWVSTQFSVMRSIFQPGTILVLFLIELGLVWVISSSIQKVSSGVATTLFLIYAAINGLVLSSIFLVYKMPEIAGACVVT